ncbi:uncharacterized protein PpBr36_09393 [Pyricularia pennisetigena]|uniref:uncharacterized protein n=1 Tax=Pyricularia pennisetigena TaxID=1578925 RepID=UPI00114F90BA|nr:uncharacterized protein PpBr36_09393 [Pyricularia pennisetigena]TLS22078.1 hypothetical protein PpBr36_09393 [Pyricularia pennisetigena]
MAVNPSMDITETGLLQAFAAEALLLYPYVITAFILALAVYSTREKYANLPRVNPRGPTELTTAKQRAEFLAKGPQIISEGTKKYKDQPFMANTELGSLLVIPPKYVAELKSNQSLLFRPVSSESVHTHLKGLEPVNPPVEINKVINTHLTKALLSLTKPMSDEATESFRDIIGDSKEWTVVDTSMVMLFVTRISSRIFMGKELCNNKGWIEASSAYVATVFHYRFVLHKWPRILRPIANMFLPGSIEIRRNLKRCQDALQPYIDQREAHKQAALARGEKNPYNDSIEWFAQEMKNGHYDPAACQIGLALVAIHTTSDLIGQTLFDVAKNPHLIEPLRREVINVLGTYGLKKGAFPKLVLMDACFKETQRLRPIFSGVFQRKAMDEVKLSDGFVIKKGTKMMMDGPSIMLNEEIYPDPFKYDPYRFVNMRQNPAMESRAHLVSISAEHFGFGHGTHACPGRFFAANEVKIALAHILLKYDWKIAPGSEDLKPVSVGISQALNPEIKFMFRRRQEELDLDSLET